MYGLQRSGTNYFESLMRLNYPDVKFLNGEERNHITHKHFRLYAEKKIIPEEQFANTLSAPEFSDFCRQLPVVPDVFIIISKDPINWFVSYKKWSIKNNWPAVSHHYIQEYNLFYGMWKRYAEQSNTILFIRYDDLLRSPAEQLARVAAMLGYPELKSIRSSNKVYASRRFTPARREEHLKGSHARQITENDRSVIVSGSDEALNTFLGYSPS